MLLVVNLLLFVKIKNGQAGAVRFHNVPSFVVALGQEVDVPELGKVKYDLAYGGAFYAFVDAQKLGIPCTSKSYRTLIEQGMNIKRAVMATSNLIKHPFEDDLSFLYGTIFIGGPISEGVDSRNVCVFADGEVDRCPTGSGVSARMAIHYKRNQLEKGQKMSIESILGTKFDCSVHNTTKFGTYDAVVPEVSGEAFITGRHEFLIDPSDPLKEGFILR